ncbi:tripartite tricarboxylate transporter substrate binding protein [Hydrogenophaga sp.]|uniref:Bug family tripartite tricarboxylate transporter substrate binding protein n=1 Tax=Hydrogenophaga sp. TaxID=1904254 RepID=UPI0025BEC229|nr:tripartite tricarboxylate transporter substrate binding protein [Hydrogenophaga sp.]
MTISSFSPLRRALAVTLAGVALPLAVSAQASWPNKPVRMVVPFAAGGTTDVVARMVGQKLSVLWGHSVVVENKGGAGGNVGADVVAKSPNDGYTVLMASGSITINPHLYKSMPFDTKKDLQAITNVASGPMLLVVPDNSPAKTVQDLIAMAKAQPGKINFGSAGVGSQVHLAGENFADAAGIAIMHVPYRGEAPAYTDLMGGRVDMMVGNFAAASALLGDGRLRALGVTGKQRSPRLPNVPTVAESGLPGFENIGWFGLFAPAGTPPAIIAKIQQDTAKVLADPETRAQLDNLGISAVGNSTADFVAAMELESARWATVVKNRGLSAN